MAESALTFVIESINAVDAGALVVSAQHKKVLGIFYLVRKQQTYSLQRLLAAINIVTEEQVVTFWRKAAIFKQSQ